MNVLLNAIASAYNTTKNLHRYTERTSLYYENCKVFTICVASRYNDHKSSFGENVLFRVMVPRCIRSPSLIKPCSLEQKQFGEHRSGFARDFRRRPSCSQGTSFLRIRDECMLSSLSVAQITSLIGVWRPPTCVWRANPESSSCFPSFYPPRRIYARDSLSLESPRPLVKRVARVLSPVRLKEVTKVGASLRGKILEEDIFVSPYPSCRSRCSRPAAPNKRHTPQFPQCPT